MNRAVICVVFCLAWHHADASNRQWYNLTIDGKRVGYAWHDSGQQADSEVTRVDIQQLRERVSTETRVEVIRSAAGLPQRINVESAIGGSRNRWQGTFGADALTVEAGTTGFAVPGDLVLPDRLSEALKPLWQHTRQTVDFPYLEPTAGQPVRMRADLLPSPDAVARIRTSATFGGAVHNEVLWMSVDGQVLHRERKFYGATLVWEPCQSDCNARVNVPFDVISKLVVQSPFRIPKDAFDGPIRYVLSRVDGSTPHIPSTGEQAVVVEGVTAVLTVCAKCGVPEALTETDRQRYLQPNAWVQSDLPQIRSFANRYGKGRSQKEIMDKLVTAVQAHMTGAVDYLGYGNAADALRTRSGDCTEFAVLLAALARARDIPARVAYGLVYADRFSGKKEVFSPHAWVQVWTGDRWQSYDAGVGQFDATHLALSLGNGDPRDVQTGFSGPTELRIEKLGRVR
jgi:hypothetical protein